TRRLLTRRLLTRTRQATRTRAMSSLATPQRATRPNLPRLPLRRSITPNHRRRRSPPSIRSSTTPPRQHRLTSPILRRALQNQQRPGLTLVACEARRSPTPRVFPVRAAQGARPAAADFVSAVVALEKPAKKRSIASQAPSAETAPHQCPQ